MNAFAKHCPELIRHSITISIALVITLTLNTSVEAAKPVPWSTTSSAFHDCIKALEKLEDQARSRKDWVRYQRNILEDRMKELPPEDLPQPANKKRGKNFKSKLYPPVDAAYKEYKSKCNKMLKIYVKPLAAP